MTARPTFLPLQKATSAVAPGIHAQGTATVATEEQE